MNELPPEPTRPQVAAGTLHDDPGGRVRRRAMVQLIGVVIGLLIVGFVIDAAWPRDGAGTRLRSSLSPRADGFLGLHELLRRLGVPVARHHASWAALPPAPTTVLVVLDPLEEIALAAAGVRDDDAQSRGVREWVERGGHLVVALPGRFAIAGASEVFEVESAPPNDVWSPIRQFGEAARTWGAAVLVRAEDTRSSGPVVEVDGPGDHRSRWAAPTPADAMRLASWIDLHEAGGEADARHIVFENHGPDTIVTLAGRAFVQRQEVGLGAVWLCASPYPFSNLALARHGTARFVAALLTEASEHGTRSVVFDEYTHGLLTRRGGWHWVRSTGLFWPLLAGVLLVVLAAWRHGLRLGPPLPERLVPRRAKEEFVQSLAEVARRAGRHAGAARRILDAHAERLRARRGGGATARAAPPPPELAPLYDELDARPELDDAGFARFVAEVEKRFDEAVRPR